jgi:putative aldouronate transport system permease protein
MFIPTVTFFILFKYIPIYGLQIAFKNYRIPAGIWGSPWLGFDHFEAFFTNIYAWRIIRNTLRINLASLLFGFPAPIIFALLLNEIRSNSFKRTVQTITYLPHFVSTVVIVGIVLDFLSTRGLVNTILESLGMKPIAFMINPDWFTPIYVSSGIWQNLGWGSIIYLAAITGIDPQLYEAATIDGANRWRKLWHVTLPGIAGTITILFILRIGSLMSMGFEKVILLYNPVIYEKADVISSFVFRRGLQERHYDFAAAVGLFNSIINFVLLISANRISRKMGKTSLW